MWTTLKVFLLFHAITSMVPVLWALFVDSRLDSAIVWVFADLMTLYVIRQTSWLQALQSWLSKVFDRRGATAAAAGIASLVGDCSPAEALAFAKQRFRSLPLNLLELDDIATSPR